MTLYRRILVFRWKEKIIKKKEKKEKVNDNVSTFHSQNEINLFTVYLVISILVISRYVYFYSLKMIFTRETASTMNIFHSKLVSAIPVKKM